MNSRRTFFLMVALTTLLLVGILGGAYGSKQILAKKSVELMELKAQVEGYNRQQLGLIKAKQDIATYDELYKIAKVIVPENKNQAETVGQIVKLAGDNSIRLGSISFPSSSLGSGPAAAVSPTAKTSLTAAPKVNIGNADLSQLVPVVGSPGVFVLQINIASDSAQPASYPQLISFLSALENNRLTAEVTTVSIVPDSTTPSRFSFTLSLNSYIKP